MVECPCCRGTGWAQVGLIGFGPEWKMPCDTCDDEHQVDSFRAYQIKEKMKRRTLAGKPALTPGGIV